MQMAEGKKPGWPGHRGKATKEEGSDPSQVQCYDGKGRLDT